MKILLVEDNLDQGATTKFVLENWGKYEVTWMRNGQDALQVVTLEQFDCILLDHYLIGMTSAVFLRRLRAIENYQNTPVIIVSGAIKEKLAELANLEHVQILSKPFAPQVLLDILRGLGK